MKKQQILLWSLKYQKEYYLTHSRWALTEEQLGDRFRKTKTITKADLIKIVKWKFKRLKGRRNRILKLIQKNTDEQISRCNKVFDLTTNDDLTRIGLLNRLHGIGSSLASVVLSFYDPKNYGILDIHVWRELFGKEPDNLFAKSSYYIKLLSELRTIADKYDLEVRTVEKAYFFKNLKGGEKNE